MAQDVVPSSSTQPKVSQCAASDGSESPKASTAIASSTAVSSRTVTDTRMIFPAKYADFGMGVDARRRNMPRSRSSAMLIAKPENATLITPAAMIPEMKTNRKSMSVPSIVPVKIEPRITSSRIGNNRVNTRDWRFRKNAFNSTLPRARPVDHTPGSATSRPLGDRVLVRPRGGPSVSMLTMAARLLGPVQQVQVDLLQAGLVDP